jgi:HK97 family phage major capsid protein
MIKKLIELRQERAKLVQQARDIYDKAEREKREMTAAEQEQFDGFMKAADAKRDEAAPLEKQEERAKQLAESEKELEKRDGPRVGNSEDPEYHDRHGKGEKFEFRNYKKRVFGGIRRPDIRLEGVRATKEYEKKFRLWCGGDHRQADSAAAELRSMQMDVNIAGGFLVPPLQFVAQLIQVVDDLVFIRKLATKYTVTNAVSMGVPTRDTDVDDTDWTVELAVGNESAGPTVGRRDFTPHPLAKMIKLSNKLIRASAVDPEALINQRLAYKFAITQEKAFLLGTGSTQPLGLFVASPNGISTARDFQTGSTTGFTADGIIGAKYNQKFQYWAKSQWLFHRNSIAKLRQLKDAQNQYLWNPAGLGGYGLVVGAADTLLGHPLIMSEYVPNTYTTGQYVGLFGDFSQYWIVDALDMQMQRLVELFAVTNQVGFIGRLETDGMPVLEEAFTRLITN